MSILNTCPKIDSLTNLGVGGWADVGIDPALYAKQLMEGATIAVEKDKISDPKQILQEAYDYASTVTGSSTACIASIEANRLRIANLGDSGLLLIRNNELVLKTREQQHSFNFPFQIGTGSTDLPQHAETYDVEIEAGDIVILGELFISFDTTRYFIF